MTSQVRSKSKCLTILSIWICRALEPYEMEISQYIDIDRGWDTSKYHPKLSVSIFKVKVVQGHEVKGRSNWKFWVWAAWYLFLTQFFVKNAKNDHRTLFEPHKTDKFWKSGKCRNHRKQREKWPFSTFKTPKLGHFSRYLLDFFYTYTPDRVLSHIFVYWKFEKFPHFFFKKNIFCWLIFKIFKFQNFEIQR